MSKSARHADTVAATVVIPVHNAATTLEDAVRSIDASVARYQTESGDARPFRLVMIDDASTDASRSVIAKLTSERSNVVVGAFSTNLGAGAVRNYACRFAAGDLIFFLDADDLWTDLHVLLCMRAMQRFPMTAYCKTLLKPPIDMHPSWKRSLSFSCPSTTCVRPAAHFHVGGFGEGECFRLGGGEDVLYAELLQKHFYRSQIDVETVIIGDRPNSHFMRMAEVCKMPLKGGMARERSWLTENERLQIPEIAKFRSTREELVKNQTAATFDFPKIVHANPEVGNIIGVPWKTLLSP